jgi:hypothetical protein
MSKEDLDVCETLRSLLADEGIDNCDLLSFASKSPRSDGRARAATGNHQIKIFRLCLLKYRADDEVSALFMLPFLSEQQVHAWLALI